MNERDTLQSMIEGRESLEVLFAAGYKNSHIKDIGYEELKNNESELASLQLKLPLNDSISVDKLYNLLMKMAEMKFLLGAEATSIVPNAPVKGNFNEREHESFAVMFDGLTQERLGILQNRNNLGILIDSRTLDEDLGSMGM